MYPIYSLGRGGLKDKTVACANSKFDGDYIVAACNSVPRLIDMIEYLAGRLCDENHGDNDFDGKIQDAFEMTEPKECTITTEELARIRSARRGKGIN